MEVLRLLTINDEHCVIDAGSAKLDPKTLALVRLGALVAVGGAVSSCGAETDPSWVPCDGCRGRRGLPGVVLLSDVPVLSPDGTSQMGVITANRTVR